MKVSKLHNFPIHVVFRDQWRKEILFNCTIIMLNIFLTYRLVQHALICNISL